MAVRKHLTKEGKEEPPRLERFEILERINQLQGRTQLRDKAFISYLYLTGCRVEEACKYIREKNRSRTITSTDAEGRKVRIPQPIFKSKLEGEPIKRKQFEFKGDVMIVHSVRCLKRRKKVTRPIPIVALPEERPFINHIIRYLKTLEPEDDLFPFIRKRANQILETVDLYPHYLRHLRATHLVTDYNYDTEHLKKFFGWASSETASNYVHLNVEDLITKMKRRPGT